MRVNYFGLIKEINCKEALLIPGVRGVFTGKDFVCNQWGTIFQDQPLLADGKVQFAGEPVALVAADSREIARKAARSVKISIEALPAIFSVEEAKKARSFIGSLRKIERGSVEKAFAGAPKRLTGRVVIRGADHFYLESQVAIAYPNRRSPEQTFGSGVSANLPERPL